MQISNKFPIKFRVALLRLHQIRLIRLVLMFENLVSSVAVAIKAIKTFDFHSHRRAKRNV